jgi:hypothetical protein
MVLDGFGITKSAISLLEHVRMDWLAFHSLHMSIRMIIDRPEKPYTLYFRYKKTQNVASSWYWLVLA